MATRKAYPKCKSALVLLSILLISLAVAVGIFDSRATLTDQGDGTIYDDSTQLLWKKNVEGDRTWAEATAEAAASTDLGANDWRLPTLSELQGILDTSNYPQINSLFEMGREPKDWTLWSSETIEDDDFVLWDRAYVVFLGDGTSRSVPKVNHFNFILVRTYGVMPPENAMLWTTGGNEVFWSTGGDTVAWE